MSQQMLSEAPATTTVELVDLDAEVFCSVRGCTPLPAEAIAQLQCPARHEWTMCAAHHRQTVKAVERIRAEGNFPACVACGQLTLEPVVVWRPL